MSKAVDRHAGFFVETGNENGSPGNGQPGGQGPGAPSETNPQIVGGTDGEFTQAPEAPKRRGRPVGSKNRSKAPESDSFGLSGTLGEDRDKTAEKDAKAAIENIKARHLMLAMLLGLPELELDDKKAAALALAWVRFQQEYPKTKISRRVSVVVDLGAAATGAYLPILAKLAIKARTAANARKRPGFDIPPINPAMRREQQVDPKQTGPVGNEFVVASGVPDGGKINFEA